MWQVLSDRCLVFQYVEVDLRPYLDVTDSMKLFLCDLILGIIFLDRHGRSFLVDWGVCIEHIFKHG